MECILYVCVMHLESIIQAKTRMMITKKKGASHIKI